MWNFLQSIDKSTLFPAINAGGVLPRKTFSIGEANERGIIWSVIIYR